MCLCMSGIDTPADVERLTGQVGSWFPAQVRIASALLGCQQCSSYLLHAVRGEAWSCIQLPVAILVSPCENADWGLMKHMYGAGTDCSQSVKRCSCCTGQWDKGGTLWLCAHRRHWWGKAQGLTCQFDIQ